MISVSTLALFSGLFGHVSQEMCALLYLPLTGCYCYYNDEPASRNNPYISVNTLLTLNTVLVFRVSHSHRVSVITVCFGCYLLGVYLPLLWEQSFCWKSPIALGYTRGHFSALVAMENDGYDNRGAGANLNTDDDVTVTFLPLVDSERKLLHIHFLSAQEVRTALLTSKHSRAWIFMRV